MIETATTCPGVENAPIPDQGYALVKVEYRRHPSQAQTVVEHFETRDEVFVPPGTDQVGYVVYNRAGECYTATDFS